MAKPEKWVEVQIAEGLIGHLKGRTFRFSLKVPGSHGRFPSRGVT